MTSRLMEHIHEQGFRHYIAAFVEHGGRYYGGSAGAVIAGELITIAALADNDPRAAAGLAALGLVSGVTVLPHADTFAPTDIQSWARELDQRLVAIPEAGGVEIRDDDWTVIGPGSAILSWGNYRAVFPPGSRIPSTSNRSHVGNSSVTVSLTGSQHPSVAVTNGPRLVRHRHVAPVSEAKERCNALLAALPCSSRHV
jgi:hypothetical protein